jgi:hypothetical protein
MRKIRAAQLYIYATEGHYGSFEKLVSRGLLEESIFKQGSYKYKLVVDSDSYSVEATPVNTNNMRLYMDQSGIIRANTNSPATKNDEPIKMQ